MCVLLFHACEHTQVCFCALHGSGEQNVWPGSEAPPSGRVWFYHTTPQCPWRNPPLPERDSQILLSSDAPENHPVWSKHNRVWITTTNYKNSFCKWIWHKAFNEQCVSFTKMKTRAECWSLYLGPGCEDFDAAIMANVWGLVQQILDVAYHTIQLQLCSDHVLTRPEQKQSHNLLEYRPSISKQWFKFASYLLV